MENNNTYNPKGRPISIASKSSRLSTLSRKFESENIGRVIYVNPINGQKSKDFSKKEKKKGILSCLCCCCCGKSKKSEFLSNIVRTARYTVANFLPKQLVAQFSKLANVYFLFISCLQVYPNLSPTGKYTTLGPLCLFVALAMAREAYDDYFRHKQDATENGYKTKRFVNHQNGHYSWESVQWKDISVGDILCVSNNEAIPADIIVLATSNDQGICFIETASLDGETNLKQRQALKETTNSIYDDQSLSQFNAKIQSESPNEDLYNYDGYMEIYETSTQNEMESKCPLTINQLIPRGAILRNTKFMFVTVVFTGEETRIRMNASSGIRTKAPALDSFTNKIVASLFTTVLCLALLTLGMSIIWKNNHTEESLWYLRNNGVSSSEGSAGKSNILQFFTNVVLYNTIIPISLYVTMEVIKLVQVYFMNNDLHMYDEVTDTPCEARTSSLNEDLGQVRYIFTDKTGTLTENLMMFKNMSVAGISYIHDVGANKRPGATTNPNLPPLKATHQTTSPNSEYPMNDDYRMNNHRTPISNDFANRSSSCNNSRNNSNNNSRYNLNNDIITETNISCNDRDYYSHSNSPLTSSTSFPDIMGTTSEYHTPSNTPLSARPLVTPTTMEGLSSIQQTSVSTRTLVNELMTNYGQWTPKQNSIIDFLIGIALCHTVVPENKDEENNNINQSHLDTSITNSSQRVNNYEGVKADNRSSIIINPQFQTLSSSDKFNILYQASSPDEMALVNAARQMRVVLTNKTMTDISLNILGQNVDTNYKILNCIEFTSARKRMSVIYEYPDGRIMLICKGADSCILERLKKKEDMTDEELNILNTTNEHLTQYSEEGLRTLLYGYKEIDWNEYQEWENCWNEASTALSDRSKKMAEAAELIEKDFSLLGATAIEDKLQKEVPQTIENLRSAGIRVWMLTGDKKETAFNIGLTCRIIKENSTIYRIEGKNLSEISKAIDKALVEINRLKYNNSNGLSGLPQSSSSSSSSLPLSQRNHHHRSQDLHLVVIIDGDSLSKIEKEFEKEQTLQTMNNHGGNQTKKKSSSSETKKLPTGNLLKFLELGCKADSVICCRFSPSQKALVVKNIRNILIKTPSFASTNEYSKSSSAVTLAIGDGANDVPMIQAAHVGIGITGREGLAAARASDYSIAQFRFLQPLLFIHGHYSYIRICKFLLGTFYKCTTFYTTQLLFQIFTGWSGTSLYEQWTLSMYNVLFTSIPVLIVGIFEKDVEMDTLLANPKLYQYGQHNLALRWVTFWRWLLQGLWHSAVSIFVPFIFYGCFKPLATTEYFDSLVYTDGRITYFGKSGLFWKLSTIFNSDGTANYNDNSLYFIGSIVYTSIVIIVTLKVLYSECHNITLFTHLAAFFSIGIWFLFNVVYQMIYKVVPLGYETHLMWWNVLRHPALLLQTVLIIIITVVTALIMCDYQMDIIWNWFDLGKYRGNESLDIELCQRWEKQQKNQHTTSSYSHLHSTSSIPTTPTSRNNHNYYRNTSGH